MANKKNSLISAIKSLYPYQVIDAQTGELIDVVEWECTIKKLLEYCQSKTTEMLESYSCLMNVLLTAGIKTGSPTGFAWKYGIRPNLDDYPKECLAASRVEKVIQHSVVSLYSSYWENDNPKKQPPSAGMLVNLGAADKQIAAMKIKDRVLELDFRCWDKHYIMFFFLPIYIFNYNIKKFALPSIRWDKKADKPLFTFSLHENFVYSIDNSSKARKVITGAYDLGRKKPFVLSIVNHKGGVIAEYEASPRLRDLNDKRERLIREKKDIYAKIDAYEALRVRPEQVALLRQEVKFKTSKIKSLGEQVALLMAREIADLCVRHHVDVVACEDLSWVNDAIGRSSKWNHSRQQSAVEHALKREGIKQVKRSARNTSKTCCECGSLNVSVNSKKRVVSCRDCGYVEDRDRSSSRYQARREARFRERARIKSLLEEQRAQARVSSFNFSWFPARLGVGAGLAVVPFEAQAWRQSVSTGLIELVSMLLDPLSKPTT